MGYKPGGGTGAVGPVGPAAGTLQALTPLAINGNNAVHATSGALVASWIPYTGPSFYVDPVGGNDANNGTIGAPFLTIDRVNQVVAPGFFDTLTINLRAGTHTLAANTVWPTPSGKNSASSGGVLVNGVDSTDSGLGARTAAGGTAGVTVTFGTCIDSVGGLGVNAHRGQFLRFTSGATLNGRSFLIQSNTANTFTIEGVFPVAPTVETFVVETPAAVLSWAALQNMQATGLVGFQNVAFNGPGGANALRLSRGIFGQQRCTFANLGTGGIQLRNGAVFTDTFTMATYLGLTITQQCGSFFNTTPFSIGISAVTGMYPGGMAVNRSLFVASAIDCSSPVAIQALNSTFTGNSFIRCGYGAVLTLGQTRHDTVTPAPTAPTVILNAQGAAIVLSKRATGALFNVDIANTPAATAPGDAILCEDGSTLTVTNVTGAGNAGLGVRVSNLSQLRQVGANTLTGAAGDVQIGAAAVIAWAALAAINTDAVQLCIGGP